MIRSILIASLILGLCAGARAMEISDVIQLAKDGKKPAEIVDAIQKSGQVFSPTVDDLIAMKQAGVDDSVVLALYATRQQKPAAKPAPAPAPAPVIATPVPAAPVAPPPPKAAPAPQVPLVVNQQPPQPQTTVVIRGRRSALTERIAQLSDQRNKVWEEYREAKAKEEAYDSAGDDSHGDEHRKNRALEDEWKTKAKVIHRQIWDLDAQISDLTLQRDGPAVVIDPWPSPYWHRPYPYRW